MSRLTETTYQDTPLRVDADAGILRHVKLLGENSRNNRVYTREVRDAALPLYSGRKVYIDHPSTGTAERSLDRWAGTVQNVVSESDGLYGDVKLRKKSAFFDGIIEAAQEFPKDIGFSHVADGDTRIEGETEVVESIREVFSVDLVTDPATTSGFWESQGEPMKTDAKPTRTVGEILESADKRGRWAKLLKEMVDDGAAPEAMAVEVPEEADPAEEVKLALEKAAMAVLKKWFAGDLEESAAIAEIKKIAGMKDEAVSDSGGGEETPAPPVEESEQLIQLQTKLALMEAKALLLESGVEATDVRVKALAAADDTDRKSLVESWPVANQDSGLSERPASSPPRFTESHSELPGWSDAESFAAAMRS